MDDHQRSTTRTAVSSVLLVVGLSLVGWGIGNGIDNVVSHAHGQDWTVSASGSLAGIGLALVLDAVLLRRRGIRWWSYLLASLGAVLAGYSLGGGIDDLLREIDRQGHHFAADMAFCGLGVGVAAVAFVLPGEVAHATKKSSPER